MPICLLSLVAGFVFLCLANKQGEIDARSDGFITKKQKKRKGRKLKWFESMKKTEHEESDQFFCFMF